MKTAFWGAAIIGFGLCAGGGLGMVAKKFGGMVPWTSPLTIAACIIGVVGLAVIASPVLGWRVPYVTDYRTGLLALGAVIITKIVITQAHLALAR